MEQKFRLLRLNEEIEKDWRIARPVVAALSLVSIGLVLCSFFHLFFPQLIPKIKGLISEFLIPFFTF